MDDALGLAGGAAGVKDEEIILGIQVLGGAGGGGLRHEVVIPDIAHGNEVARLGIALDDDDVLDARRVLERGVSEFLERDVFAGAQRNIGGDEELALGIVDAAGQRVRAEPAEDDRVNRADTRAAEHGHGGFGNHRHVDGHAVALLDAERFEDVRELADFGVQLRVGDVFDFLFRFALPDDGGLISARCQMAVEAVGRDIELAVLEERVFDLSRGGVPDVLAGDGGFLEPVERVGLFQPELFRLIDGAAIKCVELRGVEVRAFHGLGGRRESASGLLQGFGGNGLVAHDIDKSGR